MMPDKPNNPLTTAQKLFLGWCDANTLPRPEVEYRFHPTRKWRFDYAWPERKVALEVDGAVWVQGRHSRGDGYLKDLEKLNTALAMGWRVLRVAASSRSDHPAVLYHPQLAAWLKVLL